MKQKTKVTGIIAPRGTGKTTLAHALLMELSKKSLIVVFDPNHEEIWVESCDDMIVGNPKALAESLQDENFNSGLIVYRPIDLEENSSIDWFVKLCYLRGNCMMVIDEAHFFCSPRSISKTLSYSVRAGRHRGLSIMYITQSWSAISRVITSNSDEFYFFRIIEPLDIQGICERCGQNTAIQVRQLRQFEHLKWSIQDDRKSEMPLLLNNESESSPVQ